MFYSPVAKVDLDSLHYNYKQLKAIIGNNPVMFMVKADAYGHGMVQVARGLDQLADYFGVARVIEAKDLIDANVNTKIVVMEGFFDKEELSYCINSSLDFIIHSYWQLELLIEHVSKPINSNIWVKINSGMNRLGFNPKDAKIVVSLLKDNGFENIKFITHFSDADNSDPNSTKVQVLCFSDSISDIKSSYEISMANSPSLINHSFTRYGILRVGLAIYGVNPVRNSMIKLKPVMGFYSKVIAINYCEENSPVGYSKKWRSTTSTYLAVVAVGYGDGYPRDIKNGTPVFVKGKRYPTVGLVSMDMLVIDIGLDDISIGDEVELWGQNILIEEVAQSCQSTSYNLMCGLTRRVRRIYMGGV